MEHNRVFMSLTICMSRRFGITPEIHDLFLIFRLAVHDWFARSLSLPKVFPITLSRTASFASAL